MNSWNFIDDLQEIVYQYEDLKTLYSNISDGWFFCVYVHKQYFTRSNNESTEAESDIDFNIKKSSKRKSYDSKEYPLRSKFVKLDRSEYHKEYYKNNKDKTARGPGWQHIETCKRCKVL